MTEKPIPRWQEGPPSFAYEDVRQKMTPRERRRAFIWDLVIGFGGALLIYGLGRIFGT